MKHETIYTLEVEKYSFASKYSDVNSDFPFYDFNVTCFTIWKAFPNPDDTNAEFYSANGVFGVDTVLSFPSYTRFFEFCPVIRILVSSDPSTLP